MLVVVLALFVVRKSNSLLKDEFKLVRRMRLWLLSNGERESLKQLNALERGRCLVKLKLVWLLNEVKRMLESRSLGIVIGLLRERLVALVSFAWDLL